MKPDWKDAPEWAEWLAMDCDGSWFWYENKPYAEGPVWMDDDGEVLVAFFGRGFTAGVVSSLEQRP